MAMGSLIVLASHPKDGIHNLLPDKSIQLSHELTTQDTTILLRLICKKSSDTEFRNVNHAHKLQNVLTSNRGHEYGLF